MWHKYRFVIAGLVIILVNQLVSFAVSASRPEAFLPSGTTRYAAAYLSTNYGLSYTGNWLDLPGMTKYISIPEGQTADLMIHFCILMTPNTAPHVAVRATVRGQPAKPYWVQFTPSAAQSNMCADFYLTGVTAGQPPVKIQMDVPPGTINLAEAVMLVTANLH
jgi:hypothetical protein